jgi:hypothetical protein
MKGNACMQFLAPAYACALARGIAGDAKTVHVVALHQIRIARGVSRCFITSKQQMHDLFQ